MKNQIFQFGFVEVYSVVGVDPEVERQKLEEWLRCCPMGALDMIRPVNVHIAEAIMTENNILNYLNSMCCRIKGQSDSKQRCNVNYAEREELETIYSKFPLLTGEEETRFKLVDELDEIKILVEKPHYYERKDKMLLSSLYWDVLSFAREKGIHEIVFEVEELALTEQPIAYSAETACHTVSAWFRDNARYGMKVTFLCPDEETLAIYNQYIKY